MVHLKTIRKEVELKLEIFSVDELLVGCKSVLYDLTQYPNDNKWQIKYYEKFLILLCEY